LWIFVNLDVGSNFCEFSHILAGSRMQPWWLPNPGWFQDAAGKQVTVGVAYVSITGVNQSSLQTLITE
jgi:hypothetical protein